MFLRALAALAATVFFIMSVGGASAALLRVTWDGTFSSDVSIGSQNLGGLGYRFSSLIDNQ
ncbi:MAG: hypothetical protein AAGF94_16605, partial [Pseudomonadota bacterium]